MIPKTLPEQEEHLFAVLSGKRFLQMEGLSNEVPFFIYPYPPEDALAVAAAKKRIKNRLASAGHRRSSRSTSTTCRSRSSRSAASGTGSWRSSRTRTRPTSARCSRGCSTRSCTSPRRSATRLADGDFDIFFLTGIGEVFPYIRSHNVLNNLQSVVTGKPMLMFFPGRYEQSDTLGSSLVLFGRLKDDQYYRAKNILEQEA